MLIYMAGLWFEPNCWCPWMRQHQGLRWKWHFLQSMSLALFWKNKVHQAGQRMTPMVPDVGFLDNGVNSGLYLCWNLFISSYGQFNTRCWVPNPDVDESTFSLPCWDESTLDLFVAYRAGMKEVKHIWMWRSSVDIELSVHVPMYMVPAAYDLCSVFAAVWRVSSQVGAKGPAA